MKAWVLPPGKTLLQFPVLAGEKSLDDLSIRLPAGVYTTLRTYSRLYTLPLEDHFHRLEESASLLGLPIKIDPVEVRAALRQILALCTWKEIRFRISVDTSLEVGAIYLAAEELSLPGPEEYQRGVRVITRAGGRQNPGAKSSNFIATARAIRSNTGSSGINEVLLVDPAGNILEGLSSNFFGVWNGSLYTAESGALAGITRKFVVEAAGSLGIQVQLRAIQKTQIPGLEEAFITSASRGVLPVAAIDEIAIGLHCPGILTSKIRQAFEERVAKSVELI